MAFIGDVVVALRANTTQFTQTMKRADDRLQRFQRSILGAKTAIVGFAGAYGLQRVASGFLTTAASFEAMQIKLDTLTRGKGTETLEKINKWALEMPVNTQEAVAAFTTMQAMGLDPTIEKMETLVDVASIFGDEALGRVSLALGQMSSLGKINAQDLNQLAQVGINARKIIKEAFGMGYEEVQKAGIDIQEVIEAIWQGLDANFSGAARKSMTSWRGLWATFKSYLVEFQRQVMGAGVFDYIKEELGDINNRLKTAFHSGEMKRIALEWAVAIQTAMKRVVQAVKIVHLSITGIKVILREINRIKLNVQVSGLRADMNDAKRELMDFKDFQERVSQIEYEVKLATTGWDNESAKTFLEQALQTDDILQGIAKDIGLVPGTSKAWWEKYDIAGYIQRHKELQVKLKESKKEYELLTKKQLDNHTATEELAKQSMELVDAIADTNKEIAGLEENMKAQAKAATDAAEANKKLRRELEELDALGVGLNEFQPVAESKQEHWWSRGEASAMGVGLDETYLDDLEEQANEVQDIYTTLANNIRDVMADAFYDMARSGKISWESIADVAMRVGSQMLAEATVTYIQMAIQAEVSAMRQKAALASTGWGIALIAVGAVASSMIKSGAFGGGGPSKSEQQLDAMKELTRSIEDLTTELDHQIYMMGEHIHDWSEDMKKATDTLSANLRSFNSQRQKAYGGTSMNDVVGTNNPFQSSVLKLPWDNDRMKVLRTIISGEFNSWKNFFKEVYINAQEIIGEIRDMSMVLSPLATSYEREIAKTKDSFGNLADAAKDTMDDQKKNMEAIREFQTDMYILMQTSAASMVSKSDYRRMDQEGNWYYDEAAYMRAIQQAEENRQRLIDVYKKEIEALTGLLLSDDDLQELEDFLLKEEAFLREVEEKYRLKRADIIMDVDRYMMEVTGEAGALEQALWGVKDQFKQWIEMLEDAGASIELITEIEGNRAKALSAVAKGYFESLKTSIDDYRFSNVQDEWGLSEWTSYIQDLQDQMANLDETSENYYDDALTLAGKQWDALRAIEDLNREQIQELKSTYEAIGNLIYELKGGSLAPVQSFEFFADEYAKLMTDAMSPSATAEDVAAFEQFVPDFLDFMEAYTPNYQDLVESVVGDLESVQGNIDNLIDDLTIEEGLLWDIRTILDLKLQEIIDGIDGINWDNVVNDPPVEEPGDDDGIVDTMPVPDPYLPPDTGIPPIVETPDWIPDDGITIEKNTTAEAPTSYVNPFADYDLSPSGSGVPSPLTGLDAWEAQQNSYTPSGPGIDPGDAFGGIGAIGGRQAGGYMAPPRRQAGGYMAKNNLSNMAIKRAEGGFIGGHGIYEVGEKGGEWAMPTYEPERSAFLESTGMADQIREIIQEEGGGGAAGEPIVIENNLYIDGKYVGTIVGEQARKGNAAMLQPLRRSL